ncbi:hypothetical protein N665_0606s0019 [Sinapis alba]|nr:hypothetical protein N665_0606s0019 [Sinapis alba]
MPRLWGSSFGWYFTVEASTCFFSSIVLWFEVSRRSSGFDLQLFSCEEVTILLRGGDHSLACRWLSLGTRGSACKRCWSFGGFPLLEFQDSILCLALVCLWFLMTVVSRVVRSYWFCWRFGLVIVLPSVYPLGLWL